MARGTNATQRHATGSRAAWGAEFGAVSTGPQKLLTRPRGGGIFKRRRFEAASCEEGCGGVIASPSSQPNLTNITNMECSS